jgi:prolyl-tRNA editing enzyme YbaK/EbsC (Cys-tRNA(Pro) deacylase)
MVSAEGSGVNESVHSDSVHEPGEEHDRDSSGARSAARGHPKLAFLAQFLELHDIPHRFEGAAKALDDQSEAAAHPTCRGVPLRIIGGWRMAVIPSVGRLDLRKARLAAGELTLRHATESEVRATFPDFDAASLPPIGPHYPSPELLDWRLLQHDEVSCHSGHAEHHLFLDPRTIVDVASPIVADICED